MKHENYFVSCLMT